MNEPIPIPCGNQCIRLNGGGYIVQSIIGLGDELFSIAIQATSEQVQAGAAISFRAGTVKVSVEIIDFVAADANTVLLRVRKIE